MEQNQSEIKKLRAATRKAELDKMHRNVQRFMEVMGTFEINNKQYEELRGSMSNWMVIHKVVQELPASKKGYDVLRCLMQLELCREGGPRAHVMMRLLSRYQTLRRFEEIELLKLAVPSVGEVDE